MEAIDGAGAMWYANKAFLDQAIAAGKKIYLSHNPTDPKNLVGKFGQEVAYLLSKRCTFKQISANLWEVVMP